MMTEIIEVEDFIVNFSLKCPKCNYQNEEILSTDIINGSIECSMCETLFKIEGLDGIKITAMLE